MSDRKVQFNGIDVILPSLERVEYTRQEHAATWVSPRELKMTRKDIKATVMLVLKGDERAHLDSESHNTRGLEALTREAAATKKKRKSQTRKVVIVEQHDPESLSKKYMEVTEASRNEARAIALQDAKYARSNRDISDDPTQPSDIEKRDDLEQIVGTKAGDLGR